MKLQICIIYLTLIMSVAKPTVYGSTEKATFAGGCFWCLEQALDKIDGVTKTTSGYTGADFNNPTYKQVAAGVTGHTEAVQIEYDTSKVSYEYILEVFWRNIDPTVDDHQFCDVGSQYRPEIFFHNEQQKLAAKQSKENLAKQNILKVNKVPITVASTFYPAEGYHQDYYLKNPKRYKVYKYLCGRTQRLKEVWNSKPSTTMRVFDFPDFKKINKTDEQWRDILAPDVYRITRQQGTEPSYSGKYDKFYETGTYLCSNCQLPLFSSLHKYDSKTGWPSFWEPYSHLSVAFRDDFKLAVKRIEVVCNRCEAHLGHVFDDGPLPTNLRYCINSLSLTFKHEDDPKIHKE